MQAVSDLTIADALAALRAYPLGYTGLLMVLDDPEAPIPYVLGEGA